MVFIVIEGIDGCGKSTQAKRLAADLAGRGVEVAHLREPGGTALGESVRALLLGKATGAIDARTEALLYAAARAELTAAVIRPALARGATVLCERFVDSTLAYQGFGLDADVAALARLCAYATGGIEPDLVLVLDLAPDVALARLGRERDRIESRGAAYMAKVRAGFLELARRGGGRHRIVDASAAPDAVAAAIAAEVARVVR